MTDDTPWWLVFILGTIAIFAISVTTPDDPLRTHATHSINPLCWPEAGMKC